MHRRPVLAQPVVLVGFPAITPSRRGWTERLYRLRTRHRGYRRPYPAETAGAWRENLAGPRDCSPAKAPSGSCTTTTRSACTSILALRAVAAAGCDLAISGQMVLRSWSCELATTGTLQFLRVSRNQRISHASSVVFPTLMLVEHSPSKRRRSRGHESCSDESEKSPPSSRVASRVRNCIVREAMR